MPASASASSSMRSSRLVVFLAPFLLMRSGVVHSLELKINSVKCQSRPVTVAFDYACNGDYLCAFGQLESFEGTCKLLFFIYGFFKSWGLMELFR